MVCEILTPVILMIALVSINKFLEDITEPEVIPEQPAYSLNAQFAAEYLWQVCKMILDKKEASSKEVPYEYPCFFPPPSQKNQSALQDEAYDERGKIVVVPSSSSDQGAAAASAKFASFLNSTFVNIFNRPTTIDTSFVNEKAMEVSYRYIYISEISNV